jgi:hypothetical protein
MSHKKIAFFAIVMIIVFGATVLIYPYHFSPKPVNTAIPSTAPAEVAK